MESWLKDFRGWWICDASPDWAFAVKHICGYEDFFYSREVEFTSVVEHMQIHNQQCER